MKYEANLKFTIAHSAVLPYLPPLPYLWNLGVGKAGPKNVGEAEKLPFCLISMNLLITN